MDCVALTGARSSRWTPHGYVIASARAPEDILVARHGQDGCGHGQRAPRAGLPRGSGGEDTSVG